MKTFRQAALAAILAGGLVAVGMPAAAQSMTCFSRADAIESLKSKYGEDISARGISNDGKVMYELLTSENGSWTLLRTHADGQTCMVGSGEAWTAVKTIKPKGPAV